MSVKKLARSKCHILTITLNLRISCFFFLASNYSHEIPNMIQHEFSDAQLSTQLKIFYMIKPYTCIGAVMHYRKHIIFPFYKSQISFCERRRPLHHD